MTSVVVVGAGPVGLTAALLLARHGVDVVVLERHPAPYPLPRAVHLDDEAVRVLQAAGVADGFAAISRPMPGLRLVGGNGRTMAEFARAGTGPSGHPAASMFDQPDLERVLLDAVAAQAGPPVAAIGARKGPASGGTVELRRGVTVTAVAPDGTVHTDGGTLTAGAVLGCDGANSLVRGAVGARLRDLRFEERWLVLDVRSAAPLPVWGGVHQICDPARPSTFMHLVGDRYRWEFRLRDGEDDLDVDLPPGLTVVRRAAYTFRARLADRWARGRLFLLGDAAHQTPPFIGQGLGAGLRDAHNLAWKLAAVLAGADPRLLATYQAERSPHAERTIRAAVLLGWALTGGQGGVAAVRRGVLAAACRVPGFETVAGRQTSPRLGRSPISGTGRPYPQFDGSDELLGDGWSLLVSGRPACGAITGSTPAIAPHGAARGAIAGVSPVIAPQGVRVVDVTPYPELARWLRGRAALIRPDRIVAGLGAPADLLTTLLR